MFLVMIDVMIFTATCTLHRFASVIWCNARFIVPLMTFSCTSFYIVQVLDSINNIAIDNIPYEQEDIVFSTWSIEAIEIAIF